MTFKEKLYELKIENWYAKLLRLIHWSDDYNTHNQRYYHSRWYQKKLKQIHKYNNAE